MMEKNIRGKIALISIIAYLFVGSVIILFSVLDLYRFSNAISLLNAWGAFASLPVGAVLGFYFGTSDNSKRY